jgi:pilus assembly protein Flp/PilA
MKKLLKGAKTFLCAEEGPTAAEYSVMLALIIIVALGAISGIGMTVETIFTDIDAGLPPGVAP